MNCGMRSLVVDSRSGRRNETLLPAVRLEFGRNEHQGEVLGLSRDVLHFVRDGNNDESVGNEASSAIRTGLRHSL